VMVFGIKLLSVSFFGDKVKKGSMLVCVLLERTTPTC
jgi:hypothetical protein